MIVKRQEVIKKGRTVAGDVGRVVREGVDPGGLQKVRAVHEAEVGAAVEHVEVHAALVVEDVLKDLGKV